ncbi:hypothetical protein HPB52_016291 [Rhipicephalus sanguineus]|uniref:Uncharacterized protein n=1 Tax=Rhipicephalus sanguineus TaxID=34632 RepID=A0A9D4Q706_RHISA|nr:hypothetical protein HPB52_016291 [Rhipicephalus sanguineus]
MWQHTMNGKTTLKLYRTYRGTINTVCLHENGTRSSLLFEDETIVRIGGMHLTSSARSASSGVAIFTVHALAARAKKLPARAVSEIHRPQMTKDLRNTSCTPTHEQYGRRVRTDLQNGAAIVLPPCGSRLSAYPLLC